MITRKPWIVSIACILGAALLLTCSSGDNGPTGPATTIVPMGGTVVLPDYIDVSYDELQVGFGDYDSSLTDAGEFDIQGKEHVPGVAMVSDDAGNLVLMAVVSDPSEGLNTTIDLHSTAVALAFLNPFICTSDPENIDDVLAALETLPEMDALEYVLEEEMYYSPLALSEDNPYLAEALSDAVTAYINSFPDDDEYGSPKTVVPSSLIPQDDGVQIDPAWETSGLRLTWKGGSTFEIANRFGRWVYCHTPTESFFIYPNGDFLDVLKGSRPWEPSTRDFSMTVDANADTQRVRLYGYGFAPWAEGEWDALSTQEKNDAHAAGIATVTIEFCSQILALVTNTSVLYGKGEVANRLGDTFIKLLLADGVLVTQAGAYIRDGKPWDLSWYLTKYILGELSTNANLRAAFVSATGTSLTNGALEKLGKWLAAPVKVVMVYNSVTSVLKSAMGFSTAEMKTEFAVWRDVVAFGAVRGQVGDAVSGSPLSGVTVTLSGDENNPLQPNHVVVTGADGHYRFDNIGAGAKTITAMRSGYKDKSITVVIVKDAEITANIVMGQSGAGFSGRVLNDIFIQNGHQPETFSGTVNLTAEPDSPDESTQYKYVYDGVYSISLPSGGWWIKASHEDYHADSFHVAIPSDGVMQAPRDLILQPAPSMVGEARIDMDNDGSYELQYDISFPEVGLTQPDLTTCVWGGAGDHTMYALGVRGSSYSDFDDFLIGFNTDLITYPDVYSQGGVHYYGCDSWSPAATSQFATSRRYCSIPNVGSEPMLFRATYDPEAPACDCGITRVGDLVIDEWGTNLGDVIAGEAFCTLAGFANCFCSSGDSDGDGIDDDIEVDCARAYVSIEFRVHVGTDYLISWNPHDRD